MAYGDDVYFNTPLGSIQTGSGCNMDTKCVAYNMQAVGLFNKYMCVSSSHFIAETLFHYCSPISILSDQQNYYTDQFIAQGLLPSFSLYIK